MSIKPIMAIRKKPNKVPEFILMNNTIEALREQVEGFFEIIGSKEHIGNFVVNTYYNRKWEDGEEEGEFNCTVEGHNFRGTILYIGPLAGDFEDAPRETVDLLLLQRLHKTLGTKRWLW